MKTSKVITPKLGLSKKSDGKLAEYCAQCLNSLNENATAFKTMSPTKAELTTACNNFVAAMETCGRNGNPSNTAAKNQARETLCAMMTWCAQSCSEIAGGDTAMYEMSGFGVKSKPQRKNTVDCPTGLTIMQGPFDGSVYCSFTPGAGARCYEIQFGTNPSNTADWSSMTCTTAKRCMITDLKSMSRYYMRVRAIGSRNVMSEWCNTTEFRVL
jgi:hypothetical protein